jgi:hypothetical protein
MAGGLVTAVFDAFAGGTVGVERLVIGQMTLKEVLLSSLGTGVLTQKLGANPQAFRVYRDEVTVKYTELNGIGVEFGVPTSVPGTPIASRATLYMKSDKKPYWKDDVGLETMLGGVSFPLLAPDGSAAAPSYSFAGDPDNGIYHHAPNIVGIAAGGGISALALPQAFSVGVLDVGLSGDTLLARDGAGILAQKNGANPQTLRVYQDAVTGKCVEIYTAAAHSYIRLIGAGSGALHVGAEAGHLYLYTGGADRWYVDGTSGTIYPSVNNATDIGNPTWGPRTIHVQTGLNYTVTAAPATPGAGSVITYAKADKKLYQKDDAGLETLLGGGGGGGMTNPMTTSGDVIYGGASGTPTRLGKGADTQVLTLAAGVPTWAAPVSGGMTNPMTTAEDIIKGGASGAPARLGKGSNNQVLTIVANAVAWATLPVDPGFANPMTTSGDIIYGGASGVPTRLAKGTDGFVLKLVSGLPAWQTAAAGVSYPLLAPDGTAAAPSYSFASLPTFGIYFDSSVGISFSQSASTKAQFSNSMLALVNSSSLGFSGTNYAAVDIVLIRDAPNILALKNGANAQALRIYANATNSLTITGTQVQAPDGATALPSYSFASNLAQGMWLAGTNLIFQTPYSVVFMQSTSTVWGFNPAALTPGGDNTQDIGSSGNRIKNLYVGTGLISTGDLTVNKASPELVLNRSAVSGAGSLRVKVAGLDRWVMSLGDSTVESGANVGSDLAIYRYTDAGAYINAPFQINRATGRVNITSDTGNTSKVVFMVSSQITGGLFQVDDNGGGSPIMVMIAGIWRTLSCGAVDSGGSGHRLVRIPN